MPNSDRPLELDSPVYCSTVLLTVYRTGLVRSQRGVAVLTRDRKVGVAGPLGICDVTTGLKSAPRDLSGTAVLPRDLLTVPGISSRLAGCRMDL